MFDIIEKQLQINSISFDYIRFGNGKKNLIMIQGLNTNGIKGSGLALALMYHIFTKDYTVYLFDRRNELYDGIGPKEFADDIVLAMNKLNIDKADILGVSLGGMIAQYLAINHSDRINKLVLALTSSKNNPTIISVINRWLELTKDNNYKELTTDMAYKMYSKEYIKRYKLFLPLLTIIQKPKDKERFITLAKSCLLCNTYDELDKIKCPTLVIGAREDLIVTCDASIELANKMNTELYIYEDMGHADYEEAKDFNDRVYNFLSK